ncbi:LPXTG cell wall anchor domain-containing protein [Streptococcus sp. SGI.013]|uniref:LPXTG cell wall anchor domain-containing protein n=1 Tax=unclassified Streptococcus TaxID=2608887 RepID=UPI003D033262
MMKSRRLFVTSLATMALLAGSPSVVAFADNATTSDTASMATVTTDNVNFLIETVSENDRTKMIVTLPSALTAGGNLKVDLLNSSGKVVSDITYAVPKGSTTFNFWFTMKGMPAGDYVIKANLDEAGVGLRSGTTMFTYQPTATSTTASSEVASQSSSTVASASVSDSVATSTSTVASSESQAVESSTSTSVAASESVSASQVASESQSTQVATSTSASQAASESQSTQVAASTSASQSTATSTAATSTASSTSEVSASQQTASQSAAKVSASSVSESTKGVAKSVTRAGKSVLPKTGEETSVYLTYAGFVSFLIAGLVGLFKTYHPKHKM